MGVAKRDTCGFRLAHWCLSVEIGFVCCLGNVGSDLLAPMTSGPVNDCQNVFVDLQSRHCVPSGEVCTHVASRMFRGCDPRKLSHSSMRNARS